MKRKVACLLVAVIGALVVLVSSVSASWDAVPYRWKNCTIVNKRFPHGVGRYGAHDRTRSGDPVTNFRRSTGSTERR
jgi:hypothetical protein